MNNKNIMYAVGLMIGALIGAHPAKAAVAKPGSAARQQCTSVTVRDTAFVMLGKSSVIPLKSPVTRVIVDGPPGGGFGRPAPGAPAGQAASPAPQNAELAPSVGDMEVLLLSPTDLFFRGKRAGATNVILQDSKGACFIQDIIVTIDPQTLQSKLVELMPDEKSIMVKSAENAVVLTGTVNDTANVDEAVRIATAYNDGKRVVNLLRVSAPQQVMLEVKIAEVSKNLLDRFDIDFSRIFTSADGLTAKILSGVFGGGAALSGRFHPGSSHLSGQTGIGATGANGAANAQMSVSGGGATLIGIDAQKKDGLVRVLAEPNIMAISGQQASFLSGGKIFIPVAQSADAGGSRITLEEKEFGVGLTFTPTVLNGTRINLKLVSEVSELSQTGSPFTTVGGVTSVLPSITTRRVDTTIQLNDGQSFAIAGLIRNNVTETLKKFPGLGEIPFLGMLFRSTEFQNDQTELVFIVTPRLAKPMATAPALPTDVHVAPRRPDALFRGSAEGNTRSGVPAESRK
ncbi:MAG TPA: type II and III secretion system protein family protein [Telluria sp.]|nr:type II and III secretion system protein family protein [Telluria sp.]